jgi:cytochrome c553
MSAPLNLSSHRLPSQFFLTLFHRRRSQALAFCVRALGAALFSGAAFCSSAAGAEFSNIIAECAACHGEEGVARDVEVPHLAGQNEIYLYNQLEAFKAGRRKHKEMRVMTRQLTEQDLRTLAEYYSRLPRR